MLVTAVHEDSLLVPWSRIRRVRQVNVFLVISLSWVLLLLLLQLLLLQLLIRLMVRLILWYVAISIIHLTLRRDYILLLRWTWRACVGSVGKLKLRRCRDRTSIIGAVVSWIFKVKGGKNATLRGSHIVFLMTIKRVMLLSYSPALILGKVDHSSWRETWILLMLLCLRWLSVLWVWWYQISGWYPTGLTLLNLHERTEDTLTLTLWDDFIIAWLFFIVLVKFQSFVQVISSRVLASYPTFDASHLTFHIIKKVLVIS